MYRDHKIAVVVPAYNEEVLIRRVIETMPDLVDVIIIVDDASNDLTSQVVETYLPSFGDRLVLIRHDHNQGVGGAIITGHRKALDLEADISVVMAGDAQMDPIDLPNLLDPIVSGECEYAKGNRFYSGEAWKHMPRLRFYANAGLSMLNKIASGHWHIADPQCGYTVISKKALQRINLDAVSQGYHFENSMLFHMNVENLRVKDVPIHAVYGIGERSGINELTAFFSFSIYLWGMFLERLKVKYIIRDFHPLVFFYFFGILLLFSGALMGLYLVAYRILDGPVQATSAMFAAFLFTTGLQLVLFGMWFDKDYSQKGL